MAKHFFSNIAGVSQDPNRQQAVGAVVPGEWLSLRPEPDNAYDENAIALYRQNGQQLGYLSADVATDVSELIDWGYTFHVMAVAVTGHDKATLGCNIQIFARSGGESDEAFRA